MLTTDPTNPRLGHGYDEKPTEQHEVYLVLSKEEIDKGFVRPYRDTYRHVGIRPKYTTRNLTSDELERYKNENYVLYEIYPESIHPITGKFWTEDQLNSSGCGTTTTMNRRIAETYARNPKFYGATYCVHCRKHLPLEEFVWDNDNTIVGT